MKRRVRIVEATPQGQRQERQEQPILGELLQMAGLPVAITDVTKEHDEWAAFLDCVAECEEASVARAPTDSTTGGMATMPCPLTGVA